ncbi:hypothetical protein [Zhongshania sp. BJYM1]|uniref:hypothetical protein n=1 Tax=Zhongshania aquatica TaxID=2965069 RepID=UPI0022B32065|nr:hypothetical protein [Marortus sp. BJYM1]
MLIPLLRSGVLYMIWRRHIRQRALGMVVTALLILAVNLIHSEALAFFSATEKSNLAPLAFYFRWLGWILAGVGYLWFVERKISKAAKSARAENKDSGKSPHSRAKVVIEEPIEKHDGFDSLRHNTPLRSRAEIMLEQKKRAKPD